ncbi:hypothetical protein E2P60_04590 [Candidatus Bathyarchaeota archaeon]|nr:hypothetical protein E2P60_04590 [Candidatus Bathyarchaeota archaeon]
MDLWSAAKTTLRSKRFWLWQIVGVFIYAIPVAVRFATSSNVLPILSLLETPWIDHYVPGNLVEKILVGAFFPGGAGAVAGEIFFSNRNGTIIQGRSKYFARLGGALAWTATWTIFQFWGNLQNIMGPYGGNIFEYPSVYPLNLLIASFSIFTPDVIHYIKRSAVWGYHRFQGKNALISRSSKLISRFALLQRLCHFMLGGKTGR